MKRPETRVYALLQHWLNPSSHPKVLAFSFFISAHENTLWNIFKDFIGQNSTKTVLNSTVIQKILKKKRKEKEKNPGYRDWPLNASQEKHCCFV